MFGRRNKRNDARSNGQERQAEKRGFSPEECEATLARVLLFATLPPGERRNLVAASVERAYPAGAGIVWQGQRPGVGLFVVLAGRAQVTQVEEDGAARMLTELGPGEMFGEMALLDEGPRSATVMALEPTIALIIPIFDFRAALARNPDAAIRLLALLSRRVREAEAARLCGAPC
ncbi:MAG TPA: cyclic nucleotide-binding domain-containing protein [Ktedonobacterales bacterium]|nr:cyclic nucleotide-binding domain-containing protein [Ktedonobacterales bacterium]